jgi:hypothetical protein
MIAEILFGVFMGFLGAWLIEKLYVSRATILPSVAVIFFVLLPSWASLNAFLKWYVLIGLFFGLIALYMLIKKMSLGKFFYEFTYLLYSGKTLMPVYSTVLLFRIWPERMFSPLFWTVMSIFIVASWLIGVLAFKNKYPFQNTLK